MRRNEILGNFIQIYRHHDYRDKKGIKLTVKFPYTFGPHIQRVKTNIFSYA